MIYLNFLIRLKKNKELFSATVIRKEKVQQIISKNLKINCAIKTEKTKNQLVPGKVHFEFEEQFDQSYRKEPSMNPVSLARNLIELKKGII